MQNLLSWLFTFLQSLFAFIVILVPLVVFHEFGHFLFARLFGVKAEVFSVGFGPKLWSRQIGETEWRLSAIPMGGYVKLLGEDRDAELSPAEQKRALHRQKPWKRFFIFLGGPLFNFILAVFIFMVILVIGEPQLGNVVGRVIKGSTAEKVGFRNGDRILGVNAKSVTRFEEIYNEMSENPGKLLNFTVLHSDSEKPTNIQVTTTSEDGYSMYGEAVSVGEVDGLFPIPRGNQAGVSNPASLAARAGIKTGSKILSFNTRPLSTWERLETEYERLKSGTKFSLEFEDGAQNKTVQWTKPKTAKGLGEDFGLYSSELFVEKTVAGAPAEAAGLQKGDRLIGIGHQPVQSFFQLKERIQAEGEKSDQVILDWERDGKVMSADLKPTRNETRDPVLKKTMQFTVGVIPMLSFGEPMTVIERVLNPFTLVYKATERMINVSWANLVMLKKMFGGQVSMGTIGGPLMIGKIAGESLSRGIVVFLSNMAIFSVGLGILNILPVPVLDGGHLLLLGVESVRRKPLTLKQMEVVQGVGLLLILALMGVAFHNDISRLIYS